MRKYISIKASLLTAATALSLSACGFSGDNNFTPPETGVVTIPPAGGQPPVDPPPPTGDGTPQGQAGAGFAAAFNQGPNDEPVDPMAGDIIPLDKTAEPIPIPDP